MAIHFPRFPAIISVFGFTELFPVSLSVLLPWNKDQVPWLQLQLPLLLLACVAIQLHHVSTTVMVKGRRGRKDAVDVASMADDTARLTRAEAAAVVVPHRARARRQAGSHRPGDTTGDGDFTAGDALFVHQYIAAKALNFETSDSTGQNVKQVTTFQDDRTPYLHGSLLHQAANMWCKVHFALCVFEAPGYGLHVNVNLRPP